MYRLRIASVFTVAALFFLAGCDGIFEDPQEGNVFEERTAEFKPLSDATLDGQGIEEGEGVYGATVQLLAPLNEEPVTFGFEVVDDETSAQEGLNYEFVDENADGTFTFEPDDELSTDIGVVVLDGEIPFGQSRTLTIELVEAPEGYNLDIAENLRTFELGIDFIAANIGADVDDVALEAEVGEEDEAEIAVVNEGGRTGDVTDIRIEGEDADVFAIEPSEDVELGPEESDDFTVTFSPESEPENEVFEASVFMERTTGLDADGNRITSDDPIEVLLTGAIADEGNGEDNGDGS